MLDLIIKGGQVVTPEGVAELDLGIQGERIAVAATPGRDYPLLWKKLTAQGIDRPEARLMKYRCER